LTEWVLQGHLPILAGNVDPHEARTAWRRFWPTIEEVLSKHSRRTELTRRTA
jgi:hypothetical protein